MMNKVVFICISLFVWASHIYPMEGIASQEVKKNPFDLITDDHVIRQISDWLDAKSCARMRRTCRRFNNAAWQFDENIIIPMPLCSDEKENDYWKRVFDMVARVDAMIERFKAHNIIILFPQTNAIIHLSLPQELSKTKIQGLYTDYFCVVPSELDKLPKILPDLKFLALFGRMTYRFPLGFDSLPLTLQQLKKLETLYVLHIKTTAEDLRRLPASLTSLDLTECEISEIPESIADLKCLQSLSLWNNNLSVNELEKLAPLASYLKKLCISRLGLEKLPQCLASFEKLQEIDISQNHLSPHSLYCLTRLKNLRRINLAGNRQCESQQDLIKSMFSETVTIFI